MSKIGDAAERVKAAIEAGEKRNDALARELDAFLTPVAHEADAPKARQADLWLGAIRFRLQELGVRFTIGESDAFFIATFGDAAAAIVAAHERDASAWAAELAAHGLTTDDALANATATLEDEMSKARSAAWN